MFHFLVLIQKDASNDAKRAQDRSYEPRSAAIRTNDILRRAVSKGCANVLALAVVEGNLARKDA